MDNEALRASLFEAIHFMVTAPRRSSSKGKLVQKWFEENYRTSGITGLIMDSRQTGNRIVEQFKHKAKNVVFLYDPSVNPESIAKKTQDQQYPELETVLLVKFVDEETYEVTHLLFLDENPIVTFYRQCFTPLEETVLENIRLDLTEASRTVISSQHKKYWIYAAGDNSAKWEEFYADGIMAIGWDEMGDLSSFPSKEAMKQRMKQLYGEEYSYKNSALATWQFVHDIQPGDVVFVKRGRLAIIGRGIIESDYSFDDTRNEYKNVRRVCWTHKGEWEHPGLAVMKALTEITAYTDYVEKLETLILGEASIGETQEELAIEYPTYSKADFLNEVFMTNEQYDTLLDLLSYQKNIILQGAPGVGKTFAAKRLAYSIIGVQDSSRVQIVQFHQSYSYEDFIMGYRPNKDGFDIVSGPFYDFCKAAQDDDENDYFFIIDEINRGNMSKIFGELLMLIERDKRGESLRLLYSNELFSVPKNVYIIGMMNTADRSLALIDYALRRRFAFFELVPGFDTPGFQQIKRIANNPRFDKLVERIKDLNKAIADDEALGKGFCVGHSYLCIDSEASDKWLSGVINHAIIPLLEEYWFDEPDKVEQWSIKLRGVLT